MSGRARSSPRERLRRSGEVGEALRRRALSFQRSWLLVLGWLRVRVRERLRALLVMRSWHSAQGRLRLGLRT